MRGSKRALPTTPVTPIVAVRRSKRRTARPGEWWKHTAGSELRRIRLLELERRAVSPPADDGEPPVEDVDAELDAHMSPVEHLRSEPLGALSKGPDDAAVAVRLPADDALSPSSPPQLSPPHVNLPLANDVVFTPPNVALDEVRSPRKISVPEDVLGMPSSAADVVPLAHNDVDCEPPTSPADDVPHASDKLEPPTSAIDDVPYASDKLVPPTSPADDVPHASDKLKPPTSAAAGLALASSARASVAQATIDTPEHLATPPSGSAKSAPMRTPPARTTPSSRSESDSSSSSSTQKAARPYRRLRSTPKHASPAPRARAHAPPHVAQRFERTPTAHRGRASSPHALLRAPRKGGATATAASVTFPPAPAPAPASASTSTTDDEEALAAAAGGLAIARRRDMRFTAVGDARAVFVCAGLAVRSGVAGVVRLGGHASTGARRATGGDEVYYVASGRVLVDAGGIVVCATAGDLIGIAHMHAYTLRNLCALAEARLVYLAHES